MKVRALLAVAATVATATGCQTVPNDYDRPARIVNPDAASFESLQLTVKHALGGNVVLSDSALTDSSILTIENLPKASMENPVPHGRVYKRPVQFRLVMNGNDCILVNQQDRSRYVLENTTCIAE